MNAWSGPLCTRKECLVDRCGLLSLCLLIFVSMVTLFVLCVTSCLARPRLAGSHGVVSSLLPPLRGAEGAFLLILSRL